jgi:SAM-dependent methyltransferase
MDPRVAANRALWDEWTPIHVRSDFYDVEGWKSGAKVDLYPLLVDEVGDVAGKDLLHLRCHLGPDTLAWARRGARVTGVDVVFTSFGALNWLPDVPRWAEVVGHFVRPGGFFYIAEAHPFAWVFDDDDTATELRLRYHYWPSPEPLEFSGGESYADPAAPVTGQVEYAWQHSMGEIVTSLAGAGLRIEFLHEFPFTVFRAMPYLVESDDGSRTWRLPEPYDGKLPLMFSLKATRPGS